MTPIDSGERPAPASRFFISPRWRFRVLILAGAAIGLVAGLASCGAPRQPPAPAGETFDTSALRPSMFRKWPKPDVALVLSGSAHGYLLPCGCSHPQIGGMERRYNFIQILKQKGWPVVAFDVGDVAQEEGPVKLPNMQGLIKYRYAMDAMKLMGYAAVGIGEYEANLSLASVLDEWALNNLPTPVLIANLQDADKRFPDETASWKLLTPDGSDIKIGVTGLVGHTVAKKIKKKDPSIVFTNTREALGEVLKKMDAAKVNLRVLLYQGSQRMPYERDADDRDDKKYEAEAVECSKAFPQFDIIVCLNEEDTPSSEPVWVKHDKVARKTPVVALGHKGKYVGVLGVNRTGRSDEPFEMRYQLVEMSESLKTPKEQEHDQPIIKLIENYTRELRDGKYLAKYGKMRHSLQVAVKGVSPAYIGSDKCKKCHDSEYAVWKKSAHSHAYQTLVDAKNPGNRQYDPECIVCHTVGFAYQSGFADADKTPRLENVGCENCHGPGSEHAANPKDEQWLRLVNPWKAPEDETPTAKAKRMQRIDFFCITCHDSENDVHWSADTFPEKWKQIVHPRGGE